MGECMTWRKVSDYAITNGPQSISKAYTDGCTIFSLHEGDSYTKHSEDECEVVVQATYPDAESMRSYLETGGFTDGLRENCRAAWAKLRESSK